jgi:LysM repeat protein
MRSIIVFVIFQLCFLSFVHANMDSTGVKKINGKLFVLHQVEKGQGLYSIARRYGTTVAKIQEANKNLGTTISVGQVLTVPYGKTVKISERKVSPDKIVNKEQKVEKTIQPKTEQVKTKSATQDPIYHTVVKKETLYQIAVNHKITVEQLKQWNNIEGGLKEGQKIIVGYKGLPNQNTETSIKTKKDKTTKSNDKSKKIVRSNGDQEDKISVNKIKKEVTESGTATWVDDGNIKSEVHLAMHKTAPLGTLIKVTNPMNGKYKFVKVIGKLPDTEENNNIIIKIGKNTADELDIRDKVFRVEMTYSMEVEK